MPHRRQLQQRHGDGRHPAAGRLARAWRGSTRRRAGRAAEGAAGVLQLSVARCSLLRAGRAAGRFGFTRHRTRSHVRVNRAAGRLDSARRAAGDTGPRVLPAGRQLSERALAVSPVVPSGAWSSRPAAASGMRRPPHGVALREAPRTAVDAPRAVDGQAGGRPIAGSVSPERIRCCNRSQLRPSCRRSFSRCHRCSTPVAKAPYLRRTPSVQQPHGEVRVLEAPALERLVEAAHAAEVVDPHAEVARADALPAEAATLRSGPSGRWTSGSVRLMSPRRCASLHCRADHGVHRESARAVSSP